jgi:hypothetical protein
MNLTNILQVALGASDKNEHISDGNYDALGTANMLPSVCTGCRVRVIVKVDLIYRQGFAN